MGNLSKDNGIKSKGFTIKESGLITKVYKVQGLDLVIEQQATESRKTTFLPHYSDPGTRFFVAVVKFMHVSGIKVPKLARPVNACNTEFDHEAKIAGMVFAKTEFPLNYQYYSPETPPAILQVLYSASKPVLQIKVQDGEILISENLARQLVPKIPLMYRGAHFHIAYKAFMDEATEPPAQMLRTGKPLAYKQLEFPFVRAMRREAKRRSLSAWPN